MRFPLHIGNVTSPAFAVLAALVGGLSCSNALAVTVSETTDFPGSSSFPGVSVGTLTTGANSVTGSLAGNCVPGDCNGISAGDTQDSFTFTIGAGSLLDSLIVGTSDVTGPTGFSVTFSLRGPSPSISTVQVPTTFVPINGTSGNLLTTPLGAGTYSAAIFGQSASQAGAYSLDWSVGLGVSAVPLPAAAWLFGSGLIGLAGIARRRRI